MTKIERQLLENQRDIMRGLELLLMNAAVYPARTDRANEMWRTAGHLSADFINTEELLK